MEKPLKATDIINFINEDKFSKYTARQIYDELGKEDFVEYIKNFLNKIISQIALLKNASLETHYRTGASKDFSSFIIFEFIKGYEGHEEGLYVKYYEETGVFTALSFISPDVGGNMVKSKTLLIQSDKTNIFKLLQDTILTSFNAPELTKLRKKLIERW